MNDSDFKEIITKTMKVHENTLLRLRISELEEQVADLNKKHENAYVIIDALSDYIEEHWRDTYFGKDEDWPKWLLNQWKGWRERRKILPDMEERE